MEKLSGVVSVRVVSTVEHLLVHKVGSQIWYALVDNMHEQIYLIMAGTKLVPEFFMHYETLCMNT